jgi:hypothetical protein
MRVNVVLSIFIASCAHNVPQDKATAADGKIKGAKPLTLENGEARDSGIVTYPGGDRVDWKMIELPAKQRGTLDIKLSWTTPRPGLKLAFDVFDAWNARIATSKRQGTARNRLATIDNANGKYFIRVYAVGRGDAGRYKLGVEFKERVLPQGPDWPSIPIPDPPKLADLPTVTVTVPCDVFDPKNPDCRDKCPPGAPERWPGCKDECTAKPPDAGIPACAKTMSCDRRNLDRRILACKIEWWPECSNPAKPDASNPKCDDAQFPPVATRIGKKMVIGNEVEITIMAGKRSNIEAGWTAVLLQGTTNKPLPGGTIKILRVDESTTIGRVSLTAQQVEENKSVLVSPPPKPKQSRP